MSRTQDIVFTLYGDYIRHPGGEAWASSLIELLGLFGVSGQAVRSTLSRTSRRGWLEGRKASRFSFHSLTPKCLELRNVVWTISLPTAERIEPKRQTTTARCQCEKLELLYPFPVDRAPAPSNASW